MKKNPPTPPPGADVLFRLFHALFHVDLNASMVVCPDAVAEVP